MDYMDAYNVLKSCKIIQQIMPNFANWLNACFKSITVMCQSATRVTFATDSEQVL